MARQKHPQWRSQHLGTNFPFEDDALLVNDQGRRIPSDVLLDAALYPVGGQAGLRLSVVSVSSEAIELWVGDDALEQRAVATFLIHQPADELALVDAHGRGAGLFVSEALRLSAFANWPAGEHRFTREQSAFVAEVCIPTPEAGVRGILLEDGTLFSGDVWLVGDGGIALSCETARIPAACDVDQADHHVVRVHAVGDPLLRRRICAPGRFETPRFLQKIVFQGGGEDFECLPGPAGEVLLYAGDQAAVDSVLRVRPTAEGLLVEAVGETLGD